MISGQGDLIVIVQLPPTGFFNKKSDRSHCLFEAVVDDVGRVELVSPDSLRVGQSQPFGDMCLRIAPAPQTGLLLGRRWCFDKDAQSLGVALPYLSCSLDIDLQQNIAARRRVGLWSSIEVSGDFCPLHKAAIGDLGPKLGLAGEHIGGFRLASPTDASRPRATEPQFGVRGHESGRDRPLADPAGAGQNDDEWMIY